MTAVTERYSLPSMLEIAGRVQGGAPAVVSLFTGAGGSCLGFRMAGFRARAASEFVPAAAETYRANFPDVPLIEKDIRDTTVEEVLNTAGMDVGELDVLEGSPPCAAFSSAGTRQKKWGQETRYSDTKQRVDDLFSEYARLLRGLRPRVFVAENVPGLAHGPSIGHYVRICAELRDSGYRLGVHQIDASWLGVPQARKRLLFIGTRDDLDYLTPEECVPTPRPPRFTVADALATLLPPDAAELEARVAVSMVGKATGREWERTEQGEASSRYYHLVRAALDEPCPTITAAGSSPSAASVAHPTECRKFTPSELKALCGFPQDFVLTGTIQQQSERMGRAVPPPLMHAVAARIRGALGDVP